MKISDFVSVHVHQGINHIVDALAKGDATSTANPPELRELIEKASELTYPIPDYEEPLTQRGWEYSPENDGWIDCKEADYIDGESMYFDTAQDACYYLDLDPMDREPFEYWIASGWLADELEKRDEKVERDFAGLTVWARCTTGQSVSLDAVIEEIHAALQQRLAA